MSELGRLLAEARTTQNLSLADVEKAIRVRQKYIDALEQGDYANLPPGAIARGFLRNYASFLGLDSAGLLQQYARESGDSGVVVPRPGVNGTRAIDYRPVEVSLISEERHSNWGRWVLALVLVLALAGGGWWLLNHPQRLTLPQVPSLVAALGPERTPTATSTSTRQSATVTPPVEPPTPWQPAPAGGSDGTAETVATEVTATPTSDLLTLPIPTTQPTPTRTPLPTATPTPSLGGISLTMKATQRSWMKITGDGKVLFQDLLEAGQQRGYDAKQELVVLTGNAGGVDLILNGGDLGTMGNIGQVVERTWAVGPDGQPLEVTADRRTATAAADKGIVAAATPTMAR